MTTLVHASGEWMSSDWPVCPISETAAPHRLGAALTYARRYSLFTMVGIAGEDDLDAPDLAIAGWVYPAPTYHASASADRHSGKARAERPDRQRRHRARLASDGPKPAPLAADASAELRDRLILELKQVEPVDPNALTAWAQRSLPLKNELSLTDAQAVELAFEAALARQTETAPDHGEPRRPEPEAEATTPDVSSDKRGG